MTGDVRCPKCGKRMTIRTAKKDDCQYYVCINYPRCKGRVSAEDGWNDDWGKEIPAQKPAHGRPPQRRVPYCPECGAETTIRTAKEDDCQYYVCVNYPRCRGRVSAEDGWNDDWGKEIPAQKPAHDRPPQRRVSHPPERGAETTIRTAKKDERKGHVGVDRSGRKGKVFIDEVWGDDWGKEIPAPKPAPYRPQYPGAQKRAAAPEKKEPSKPRPQIVPKKEVVVEKKEPPKPRKQVVPKKEVSLKEKKPTRPWWRRAPKKEAATEKKELPTPLLHVTPEKEVVSEKKEAPKPRKQVVPKKEVSLKEKKPTRPWWRRAPKKEAAPEKKESPEPQQQVAPKEEVPLKKEEAPRPRRQSASKRDVSSKKKRSMVVVIIALVIAFLAIDGMIYAAFVLR